MNTELAAISSKRISITCSECRHNMIFKVEDLIVVTSDETTTHEVRQRAVCRGCGIRGNNTYAIIE